jgi:hypothetical protein
VLENHLLAERLSPLDVALTFQANFPDSPMAAQLVKDARVDVRSNKTLRVISNQEILDWLNTWEGFLMSAWLCLRQEPAWQDYRTVQAHFEEHPGDMADFSRRRDIVSGLDLLADLDWPPGSSDVLHAEDVPKGLEHLAKVRLRRNQMTGQRHTPWKKLIHDLAESVQWNADTVAGWTVYQLKLYTTDKQSGGLGGTKKISSEDYKEIARLPVDERKAALAGIPEANHETEKREPRTNRSR